MKNKTSDMVVEELLTTIPLLFRSMRKKLVKTALVDIGPEISPIQIEILKLLEGTGKLSITEIGEKLYIARAQLTHLIDRLVDLAMVKRQAGKDDRRIIYVVLTAKGKSTLELKDSRIRNAFKEALATFTDEELKDISASLSKLRDLFSK